MQYRQVIAGSPTHEARAHVIMLVKNACAGFPKGSHGLFLLLG